MHRSHGDGMRFADGPVPVNPVPDLEVRIPAATWHWVTDVAMGEATVVAVIQAVRDAEEDYGEENWLLVGRFLDA